MAFHGAFRILRQLVTLGFVNNKDWAQGASQLAAETSKVDKQLAWGAAWFGVRYHRLSLHPFINDSPMARLIMFGLRPSRASSHGSLCSVTS